MGAEAKEGAKDLSKKIEEKVTAAGGNVLKEKIQSEDTATGEANEEEQAGSAAGGNVLKEEIQSEASGTGGDKEEEQAGSAAGSKVLKEESQSEASEIEKDKEAEQAGSSSDEEEADDPTEEDQEHNQVPEFIRETSKDFFDQYPEEDVFFATEDGNFFYERDQQMAQNHANTSNLPLYTLNRKEYGKTSSNV